MNTGMDLVVHWDSASRGGEFLRTQALYVQVPGTIAVGA